MLKSWWREVVRKRMGRAAARGVGRVRPRLGVEALEERIDPAGIFASAVAPGSPPVVTVFDAATDAQKFTVTAYDASFTGGVNVAVGDVNGDGTADLVTGAGLGGGSAVNVYDGTNGALLKTFTLGDELSRGGATVAAADFDADGRAEVVIGTMRNGAPLIQVVRFSDGTVVRGFTPFAGARSVSVAAGDYNADGTPDVIAGAGAGTSPQVIVFNGSTGAELLNTLAFEGSFTGGVSVAAGDMTGDRAVEVIASAGNLGGPRVVVLSGTSGRMLQSFYAFDAAQRSGVTAVAYDADGDGGLDLVTMPGAGQAGGPAAFDGQTLASLPATDFRSMPVGSVFDTTAPTATVSSTAGTTTGTSPIPFKVTFAEAVNGFGVSGLTVTNGTASNFVAVDAKTYTVNVTPTAAGAVTVAVKAAAATDAAGNANTAAAAFTVTYSTTGPSVAANPLTTNTQTPNLTGTVGTTATSVTVEVGGQTLTAAVSGGSWVAGVSTALAAGTYDIKVTATDAAGNKNTATRAGGLVIDRTAPTAAITSTASNPTPTSPVPFTVTFSEDVTGFAQADLTVSGGSVSGFTTVDAKTYTFSVTPTTAGDVSVSLAAGVAADAAGNTSAAAGPTTRTYQLGAPTVAANALTTNDTTPTLTGTVGSGAASVSVTVGGQTVAATISGTTWSATLPTALAAGSYDVTAVVTDAASNTSTSTRTNGLVIDATAPTATVTSTATDSTAVNPVPFTITFSEDVTGFTQADLTVTGGAVTGFAASDPDTGLPLSGSPASARVFKFNVVPSAQGAVTVSVAAGVAADAAGNTNTAAAALTRTFTGTVTIDASGMTSTMPAANAPEWQTRASGLKVWDVQTGTGTAVTSGSSLQVYYSGWVASSGTQFETNRTGTTPASFPLSNLIQGWKEGLIGMQPGGIRRLYIPAAQAYGAAGTDTIPPNSDLIFEIKLVSTT